MRLKVLLLALVFAISCVGILTTAAKAEGPTATPYADVYLWFGEQYKDKYASGATDDKGEAVADADHIMAITPQGAVGVRGAAGNVFTNFAIMARTPFGGTDPDSLVNEGAQTYIFLGVMTITAGPATITIGRFFTPYDILAGGDTCVTGGGMGGWDMLLGYSLFDAGRDQIRLSVMGFYFGFFQNKQNETANVDVMAPMLAVGYEYGNPGTPINASVHGLFQTYKLDDGTSPNLYGKAVNSFAGAGKFGMNMAPISFYVTAFYAINPGSMGMACGGSAVPVEADGKVYNTSVAAGHGGFSYASGIVKFSAGAGYKTIKYDKKAGMGDKRDNCFAVYGAVKISPIPNFALTPSFQYDAYMKSATGVKQGNRFTLGVLFESHI